MKLPKITSSLGFTMIELLVVIAVIGVLAVAVLSSINPIEQINKGRDTRTRSDAAQLINAVDRYYAIHEVYPWNDNTSDGTGAPADWGATVDPEDPFDFDGTQAGANWDWIDILSDTAEVKEGFINRLKLDSKLYTYKADGYNETMYTCFLPTSNAFQQEAAKNCENTTTPNLGADIFCDTRDGTLSDTNWICLP